MCYNKAQNLANTAWAYATVSQLDEKLFAAMASEAEWRVSGVFENSRSCVRLVEKLFTTLSRAAEWRMSGFNTQNAGNMAWAFATANQPGEFATVHQLDEMLFASQGGKGSERTSLEGEGAYMLFGCCLTNTRACCVFNCCFANVV